MQARDVMTKDVVTVEPQTTVEAVADLLVKNRISAVPVVDPSGQLRGIVSEEDLMRRLEDRSEGRPWWLALFSRRYHDAEDFVKVRGHTAGDVATRKVHTIDENMPIGEIARLLAKHDIKRVPVVRDGKLIGIVSRGDLMRSLAASKPQHLEVGQDDRALREAVTDALREVPGLVIAYVGVTVHDGVVELWGAAESADQARAARIAAEDVPGVKEVHSHLTQVATWMIGK